MLPDVLKSPKLTADRENTLALVAKGEYSGKEFMRGIEEMLKQLVRTHTTVTEEQKAAATEDVPAISECLLKQNMEAYE